MRTSILKPPESQDLQGPAVCEVAALTSLSCLCHPPLPGEFEPSIHRKVEQLYTTKCKILNLTISLLQVFNKEHFLFLYILLTLLCVPCYGNTSDRRRFHSQ